MIITHADADGWSSAGIFLLTEESKKNKEEIQSVRYATVRYINILLSQLKSQKPCKLYIFDLNADDVKKYERLLIDLAKKGFKITLIDHHIVYPSFDQAIEENGINVRRDTSMCCSELVYRQFKDQIDIKDMKKAEFLMCLGAIGDKRITEFIQERMSQFRWEKLFDLYAVLVAGIRDGHEFLKRILEEMDKDGIGFTKKIYNRATRKRFWIEKIKKEVIDNYEEVYENIAVIHIFKKYIGLSAGVLVDLSHIDYAIAIGDRPPYQSLNRVLLFFKNLFKPIFSRRKKKDDSMVRISIRSTKPVNKILRKVAKSCDGFGGGHKYACGARIPKDRLNFFIKRFINEIKNI